MQHDHSEECNRQDDVEDIHPQHLEEEIKREQILRSIRYLASHVPTAVLKHLSEEAKLLNQSNGGSAAQFLAEELMRQSNPTGMRYDSLEWCGSGSMIETNSEVCDLSDLSDHSDERHDGSDQKTKLAGSQLSFAFGDNLDPVMPNEEDGYDDNPKTVDEQDLLLNDGKGVSLPDDDTLQAIEGTTSRKARTEGARYNEAVKATMHLTQPEPDRDTASVAEQQYQSTNSSQLSFMRMNDYHNGAKHHQPSERRRRRQRAPRRSSMASQISTLSIRYFENAVSLPYASKHDSAVLFVDISGFTRLSLLLSPEDLSRAINQYFQLIVNEITHHNGDVLKFAGDAVFAEWKVRSSRSITAKSSIEANVRMNMEDCVTSAAICAAKIVSKYSDYRIKAHLSKNRTINDSPLTLNVHCGISAGELVSVHVGDDENRREYLVMGKPIQDVATAEGCAALGEVVACAGSVRVLSKTCELHESLEPKNLTRPAVIANQSRSFFTPMDGYTERYSSAAREDSLVRKVGRLLDGWNVDELVQYRRLLSLYVHPVVLCNDAANFNCTQAVLQVQSRQLQEAELRNVFVMFIAPIVSVSIVGDEVLDSDQLQLLNSIMNLITPQLDRFGGHLRQYLVDDKGLVLIATFGLRGSTFPNMVTERALPATQRIHDMLLSDLKLCCRIGCTIGNAYCGVVGGLVRHEYAVLGPSVNLAARLMCCNRNPGILVSDDIRKESGKSYSFRALGLVRAKGYENPIHIYEPLNGAKEDWGAVETKFVGREEELEKMNEIALALAQSSLPSARLVIVFGESGLGKTTLMMQGIHQVRLKLETMKRRTLVLNQVCNERDAITPFGSFGPILLAILSMSQPNSHPTAFSSHHSTVSRSSRSISTHSFQSGSSKGTNCEAVLIERLYNVCKQLNAPTEFAELVGRHLLQVDLSSYLGMTKSTNHRLAKGSKKSLATCMAEMFQYCTREVDLLMITIDDIHLADELSWQVIQKLFESGSNCLIVCTCRPLARYKLSVDPVFWGDLQSDHARTGKYTAIDLKRLSKEETTDMIAKKMGISSEDVDPHIQRRVFYQSLGIPQFVSVIFESMKKTDLTLDEDEEKYEEESKSVLSLNSENLPAYLSQLLLQRIDRFIGNGRNILSLAATLGLSFHLVDLVKILAHISDISGTADKEAYALAERSARETLGLAVEEGIMYFRFHGEECDEAECEVLPEDCVSTNFEYFFTHDVWRAAILKLVLDKRKCQLHEAIASTLEANVNESTDDFVSQIRVFNHWRQSGNVVKAGGIALIIGKTYESLGLTVQSAQLYKEAISATSQAQCDQLEVLIKLHVAAGRALASTNQHAESIPEYEAALKILEETPNDYHFPDRSIVFPIFSGLFILLKSGALPQDEDYTYEQQLVTRYVAETKLHGDPIHYARSLAMQAETFGKLGKFESALSASSQLRSFYSPELHSEGICDAYGSDRAAQSISLSTVWLMELGREKEALETCYLVIRELLPKMDIQNVHNSYMIVYPIILMLEDHEEPAMLYNLFKEYVVDPFERYFGDNGTTPSRCLHKPVLMLYDLQTNCGQELANFTSYVHWALCEENLSNGLAFNLASLSFGKLNDLVSAKICLLLAKRLECEQATKKQLLSLGLAVCRDAVALATKMKSGPCTRSALLLLNEIEEYSLEA